MFNPTPEQQAILEAARTTKNNLIINALAGAAKTTTLELIARELTRAPILSLAFNKKIQLEMEKRLPDHVASQTLNGLGHRAWSRSIGKNLKLDTGKSRRILKEEIDKLGKHARSDAYDQFSEILQLVRVAKVSGYIPPGTFRGTRLTETIPVEDHIDAQCQRLADVTLRASITEAFNGTIDFDDQIYMPTLFGGTFPKYDLILVDETQDLSGINHAMLARLVSRRVIMVGDPWQSIYGFRGSVAGGMAKLQTDYGASALNLSVSFRCPRTVVEKARARVPHMKYRDGAPDGSVEYLEEWNSTSIPDGAAVICRNNAPLFSLGFALLRKGRRSTMPGMDIGPALLKQMRKFGPETLPQTQVFTAIEKWENLELAKSKAKSSVQDRAACFRIFAEQGMNLAAACAYAEHLLKQEGPIQLMSGHKSKGLEFDTVFHLDPWRIPSKYAKDGEEMEQEKNIEYVITTRAKDRLVHISMEGLQ